MWPTPLLLLTLAFLPDRVYSQGGDPCLPLYNYRFRLAQGLKTFDLRRLSAWSGGGGPVWTLDEDYIAPFGGRQYGSGDRSTIYGTRAYGSGYPYPADRDTSTISNRPFPYGTWPLVWHNGGYMGGDEFVQQDVEVQRPGGRISYVELESTDDRYGGSTDTLYMIGDRDSVLSTMLNLVDWCDVSPRWPRPLDISTAGNIQPENVIQYYRASSFALAYLQYNNSLALSPSSTELSFGQSDDLPSELSERSREFLECINGTIAGTVPILDAPPEKEMSEGVFAAIMCSIFLGPCVLGGACVFFCTLSKRIERNKRMRAEALKRREERADFELYP